MLLNYGIGEDSWIPWTARRSSQSILKEINPEYSLEGLMPKLKLQYSGYLMWRANSVEKSLMLGKTEGKRIRGWKRMKWLDNITSSMDTNLSKFWETVKDRGAWHAAVHGVTKSLTQLSNWTTTLHPIHFCPLKDFTLVILFSVFCINSPPLVCFLLALRPAPPCAKQPLSISLLPVAIIPFSPYHHSKKLCTTNTSSFRPLFLEPTGISL